MREIKDRIIKTEPIEYRKAIWLQNSNLKEMSEEKYSKLKASLTGRHFIDPFKVWENNGDIYILDGCHRQRVMNDLEKEGVKIPVKLTANFIKVKNRKEAVELVLVYSSIYASVTSDGLYEFMNTEGLNLEELKIDIDLPKIDFEKFETEFYDKPAKSSDQEKTIESIIEKDFDLLAYDYYYFEFSGGKDSTLAMIKMLPLLREANKEYEAVFVNTGAELPDLQFHILNFCQKREIPIKLLAPKKDIMYHYMSKQKLPDPIFRECMHEFIYKPIDDYTGQFIKEGRRILGIRGGRKDQKANPMKSKADKLQKIERNGLKYLVYSPLYDLPQTQYIEELEKIEKWPGYAKGFIRTACWFCPFTYPDQWDAIKENYPMLFGPLIEISKICKMPFHKGDGNYKRYYGYFKKYW